MRLVVLISALLLLLGSCAEKQEVSYPDDILARDTLASLMTDLYLIEAIQNHKIATDAANPRAIYTLYKATFDEHNVSLESYEEALEWHNQYPEAWLELYTQIEQELSRRRDAI